MRLIAGLDTETTGTDTAKDRIVEICLIVQDLDTGDEKLRYVRRFNPGVNIPSKASAIHGIMNSDVMGCPDFSSAAPMIAKIIEKVDLVIAHNGDGFDLPILLSELVRAGVLHVTKFPQMFDTMLKSRATTSDGKYPTLSELCWAMDVEYDPSLAHGATYDVEVMLKAFHAGLKLGFYHLTEKDFEPMWEKVS